MKLRFLLISSFLLLFLFLQAQTYNLTVSEESYTPLENSISLTNDEIWDDEEYSFPIEIDFEYFGDKLDTLFVDVNGLVANTSFENIGSESFVSFILPFYNDLIDLGYISEESVSNISYLIDGEEGSRILKIEWNNVGFYDDYYDNQADPSFVNFQLWLYELDNAIEFHYGDSKVDSELVFQYYGGGPIAGLMDTYNETTDIYDEFAVLIGDPAKPNVILWEGEVDFEYTQLLDSVPMPNTVYRFDLMDVSTTEIQALSQNFSIYPNPVLTQLSIVSERVDSEIQSISIFSNDGRWIRTINSDFSNINVSDLWSGVYHIHISTQEGLAVKRFVKVD